MTVADMPCSAKAVQQTEEMLFTINWRNDINAANLENLRRRYWFIAGSGSG